MTNKLLRPKDDPKLRELIAKQFVQSIRLDQCNDTFPEWEFLTEEGRNVARKMADQILSRLDGYVKLEEVPDFLQTFECEYVFCPKRQKLADCEGHNKQGE